MSDQRERAIEAADEAFGKTFGPLMGGEAPDDMTLGQIRMVSMIAAIQAYESALWFDDMDAAPKDESVFLGDEGDGSVFECWFEGGQFVRSRVYDA